MSIFTEKGTEVPMLQLSADLLINRSIVMYGASRTGKTVMMKHCLDLLRGHVEQGILVSPSEPSNRDYSNYFPKQLVHYTMKARDPKNPGKFLEGDKGALQFLVDLWKRQEMLVQTWEQATRVPVLRQLVSRLPGARRKTIEAQLAPLNKKFRAAVAGIQKKYRDSPGEMKDRLAEAEELFQDVERGLYKKYIVEGFEALWELDLSDEERNCMAYIQLNPHMVLVLDDCGADLRPIMKKPIFKNLFYRGRHARLTVIFAFQDDTDLDTNLRKNAFVSIFCDRISAQTHFEQGSNRYSKQVKQLVNEILDPVFAERFRKLVYIRDDPRKKNFYHVTAAKPLGKMFPCKAILDVCRAIARSAGTADTSNPYFDRFSL